MNGFLEGFLITSVNDDGSVFFLAFFNYENEAVEYLNKFPEENLTITLTDAQFDEELFYKQKDE